MSREILADRVRIINKLIDEAREYAIEHNYYFNGEPMSTREWDNSNCSIGLDEGDWQSSQHC